MFSLGVPAENAQAFADLYMFQSRELLKLQRDKNSATRAALSQLRSAMSSFQTTLSAMKSHGDAIKQTVSTSNAAVAGATIGKGAQPGNYDFLVESLASSHQIAYAGMHAFQAENAGTLTITLADGATFDVDLASANADGDGNVTPGELARAINQAEGNDGVVTASIVHVNGEQQLVLTAAESGESSRISVDTSKVGSEALRDVLDTPAELAAARDAVFYLGGKGGLRIQQASNTFTGIDGVALTFMQVSETPVRLTVEMDAAGTKEAAQEFIDAYNELTKLVAELAASGGEDKQAGPFSGDAGVRSMQQQLSEMLRTESGGVRLMDYGFEVDRNGRMSINAERFDKAVAKNPEGLNALLGDGEDGVLERMDGYLRTWTSSTDGHIKRRQDSNQAVEASLNKREIALNAQYSQVFDRYLAQFTRVEQLQAQMETTLALLDSLPTFGGKN